MMSTLDPLLPWANGPDAPTIRARLRVALLAALLLGACALLSGLTHLDRALALHLAASPLARAFRPIGEAYSTWGLLPFYVPFAMLLIVGMRTRHAQMRTVGQAYLIAQACGTVALVHLLKLATARPRPLADSLPDAFFQIHSFGAALHSSFPSSHAVDVMVGASFLSVLARSRAPALLALAAALLMAVSRVLIGKHYLSDVLAGLALGAAITVGVMHAFLLPRWTGAGTPRPD